MRVLMIGPHHAGGSLPPYLDVLAGALARRGVHVTRLGSDGIPYNEATRSFLPAGHIRTTAQALLTKADLTAYDLLSVHFGNLETEQLLPVLWQDRSHPPAVYHVHSLDWSLFQRQVPHRALLAAVRQGVRSMDGYLFFGHHAQSVFNDRLPGDADATIAWLPTTIPPGTIPASGQLGELLKALDDRPLVSLYGYAAPWKDSTGLLGALEKTTVPARLVVAGPFWGDPRQAGADLRRETRQPVRRGATELTVIPRYLTAAERLALVCASTVGVFCYRNHPSFQGSGAIADYLANGTPVVATDIANMAELVGDAGFIVPPGRPEALAHALDQLAADTRVRQKLATAAYRRAKDFSPDTHAARSLHLYQAVLDRSLGVQHAAVG